MAKEKTSNDLLKQVLLQAKKTGVHEEIKDKPPETGNYSSLPSGITNGIARLTRIYCKEYNSGPNEGKPYARMEGSVVKPEVFENIPIKGRFTSLIIPLCETKNSKGDIKTFEDNYKLFLDHLKLLGLDFSESDVTDVDAFIEELLQQKPYFQFSTSSLPKLEMKEYKGEYIVSQGTKILGKYPNEEKARRAFPYVNREPIVWENWNGKIDYEEEDNYDEVEEEILVEEEEQEENTKPQTSKKSNNNNSENVSEEDDNDYDALAELVKRADEDADEEAIDKLTKIGENLGIDQEFMDEAASWADVAEEINNRIINNLADAEEGEEEEPEVGKGCTYDGNDYEIVTVNQDKRTVTLKNIETGKKLIKNKKPVQVSWDELSYS